MHKFLVCTQCGTVGNTKTAVRGNGTIEILLWLCFIVPGVIYSVWRSSSRHQVCTSCGSVNLVPADSPVGRKTLSDQGKKIDDIIAERKNRKIPKKERVIRLVGVVVVTILVVYLLSLYAQL